VAWSGRRQLVGIGESPRADGPARAAPEPGVGHAGGGAAGWPRAAAIITHPAVTWACRGPGAAALAAGTRESWAGTAQHAAHRCGRGWRLNASRVAWAPGR